MICKHCGATINKDDTACPECGEDLPGADYIANNLEAYAYENNQGPAPRSHKRIFVYLALIVLIVVAFATVIVGWLYETRDDDLGNISDVSEMVEDAILEE